MHLTCLPTCTPRIHCHIEITILTENVASEFECTRMPKCKQTEVSLAALSKRKIIEKRMKMTYKISSRGHITGFMLSEWCVLSDLAIIASTWIYLRILKYTRWYTTLDRSPKRASSLHVGPHKPPKMANPRCIVHGIAHEDANSGGRVGAEAEQGRGTNPPTMNPGP